MKESGQDSQQTPSSAPRPSRFLQRGESMVASTGLTLAAILLMAMGASAWWVSNTYHRAFVESQKNEILAVGELLAETSKSLLEADEIFAATPDSIPSDTRKNREALIGLYERWNRPDRAAEWRAVSEESGG